MLFRSASVWDSAWASVGASVWDSAWASVEASVEASVRASVWASVWSSVVDSVEASVWDSVKASVWASLLDSVTASVRNRVMDSVKASVMDSVKASKLEYVYPAWRDVLSDAGWVSFYDYFTRIGVINHDNFNRYLEYMRAGVFYGVFLKGVAIVCGRPQYINRDARGRLHAENKPAVLWHDGWEQYFWHGVSVPQKLIVAPEQITKDDLAKEGNAEVRRAMMEKLEDRFFSLLDVQEIARDTIGTGEFAREAVIFRTKEPDPVAGEYIQYVKVQCHSTGRQYMLCVPPHITSPLAAVAWTFTKEEAEYSPLVEA